MPPPTDATNVAVNWDDVTSWPPVDTMTTTDRCQASAALIRDFTGLPLNVEPGVDDGLIVVLAERFRHPSEHPEDVLHFLEGFLAGAEAVTGLWIASL